MSKTFTIMQRNLLITKSNLNILSAVATPAVIGVIFYVFNKISTPQQAYLLLMVSQILFSIFLNAIFIVIDMETRHLFHFENRKSTFIYLTGNFLFSLIFNFLILLLLYIVGDYKLDVNLPFIFSYFLLCLFFSQLGIFLATFVQSERHLNAITSMLLGVILAFLILDNLSTHSLLLQLHIKMYVILFFLNAALYLCLRKKVRCFFEKNGKYMHS